MPRQLTFLILLISLLLTTFLSGCTSASAGAAQPDLAMAPLSEMPEAVKNAPVSVQNAYRFNVANPDLMKQIPCYCGCGDMGHTSNYDCYVQEDSSAEITFDEHALGCSICVDITQDAMRMLEDGKSAEEIKQAVDDTYAKFGPSNIP